MADPTTIGAVVLTCPVDGCRWAHYEPKIQVPPRALAEVFGFGVMTAVAQQKHRWRVEDTARAHFDGHTAEDFLRTISRLQQQLEEMGRALAAMEEANGG